MDGAKRTNPLQNKRSISPYTEVKSVQSQRVGSTLQRDVRSTSRPLGVPTPPPSQSPEIPDSLRG